MKKRSFRNLVAFSSLLIAPIVVTGCQSNNPGTSIGNVVYQGQGVPSNDLGRDGDIYTDIETGNLYKKQNGVWVLTQNNNPSSYSGEGAPSNDLGVNGDRYTNTVNGAVYEKRNGEWVCIRDGDQTHIVTFNLNGGRFGDGTTTWPSQTVRDGYWVTEPTMQPIKEHCDFLGWFANGAKSPWEFTGTPVRGPVDLIAQYKPREEDMIKIEIDPDNGQAPYVVETYVGDKLYPTIPSKPGYSFAGWYVESTGAKYSGVVTSDLAGQTLIAHWEESKFNVTFQVEENNEITITGIIDIESVTVDIPNTINGRKVTKINSRAFNSRAYIENIYIPANVKEIEDGAFRGTMRLQNINVDSGNLNYCSDNGVLFTKNKDILVCYPTKGASTYTLPGTVKKIGAYAFYDSKDMGISNIYFNEGLEEIGSYAFWLNETITNLTFPSTLKKIGDHAFYGLTVGDDEGSYILPEGMMETVKFNEGLEEIGEAAFANQHFKNIFTLPSTVKTLGDYAFVNCTAITKFVIPASLENWGYNVFAGCTGILSMGIDDANTHFKVKDNIVYTYDMKKLVMCPSGRTEEAIIPEGVTEIGDGGFYMVDELQSYTFPSTLKKIGKEAFAHTYGLKSFAIPNSVTELGPNAFDLSGISSLSIGTGLTTIPYEAFIETKISNINIPSNVKTIEKGAFSLCSRLSTVKLNEGLESIGQGAFSSTSINSLEMPNSLKTIGDNAFTGANITALNIKDGLESIGADVFSKNSGISIDTLTVSSGNTKFSAKDNVLFSKDLKNVYLAANKAGEVDGTSVTVTLPEGVETICPSAFSNIKTITQMNLPSTLVTIGDNAFERTSFKAISLGNKVKTIGKEAFFATSLQEITFSEGLELIDDFAFTLSDVKSITLPNSLKVIGQEAFARCVYLETLTLGTGLETLRPFALSDNKITGTLKIPASCTSIGEGAISSTVSTYGQHLFGFEVDVNNPYYSTDGHFLMNKQQTKIIATAGAHSNTVKVPNTVKEIANYGMACGSNRPVITGLTLPNGLEKIGDYGFAFLSYCGSVTIPSSITYIGKGAFAYWTKNQVITLPVPMDVAATTYHSKFLEGCNAVIHYSGDVK